MRNILVEQSRKKATEKHGGKLERIELHDGLALEMPAADHLLALHESLDVCNKWNPDWPKWSPPILWRVNDA